MMSHLHVHTHDAPDGPRTDGNVIHWAGSYDALFEWLFRSSASSARALARVRPGDRVLDAGCGPGGLTLAAQTWAEPGGQAYGIDPSPEMIARARRNAARRRPAAQFQVGVVEALPFTDAMFDVVISRLVLHHLPGDLKQRGLAEMRRVLKPGGLCLVLDFQPPTGWPWRQAVEHLFGPAMSQADVRAYLPLLRTAGFGQVEAGPTDFRLLSFARGWAQAGHGQGSELP